VNPARSPRCSHRQPRTVLRRRPPSGPAAPGDPDDIPTTTYDGGTP
jgi:hypothetical protein